MAEQAPDGVTPTNTTTTPPDPDPPEADGYLDQEALLSKLEQQNRLLEEDSHFTTQILSSPRTSSSSLAPSSLPPDSLAPQLSADNSDTSPAHSHSPTSHDQPKAKDKLPQAMTTPTEATPMDTTPSLSDQHMLETKDVAQELTTTPPRDESPFEPQPSHQGPNDSPLLDPIAPSATPPHPSGATPTPGSTDPSLETEHSAISDPSSSPLQEAPSRDLESPTEVRSKPSVSAYSVSPHMMPVSEGEESEEGLGPEVSVILGDKQDMIIPYDLAREMEVLPEPGLSVEGEEEEEELLDLNATEDPGHVTKDPGHVTEDPAHVTEDPGHASEDPGHVTEDPGHVTEDPGHVTKDLGHVTEDPAHVTEDPGHVTEDPGHVSEDPGHVTEDPGHMTEDPGHVTGGEQNTGDSIVADSALSEGRDTLTDLPSAGSSSPHPGKGRRSRSETESRSSKVSLISFKGRKRSHTLHEAVLKEKEEQDEGLEVTSEETQWQQWSEILKNWEEVFPKNMKVVKQLARQGIPEHLRGMAWQLLSDSIDVELKEKYPTLITEMSPHERAIRRDLNRTFPEHSFFMERDGLGQESLFNVLKAYSVYDKEVGYCQGSPFMVGLLLMQMPEEEAFCVLVQLMHSYKMRDVYKPSMADLSLCFYQLEKLIEEMFPTLSIHFKAVGFQPSMYASPWFLTLFASVLPLSVAFRVVDLLLVEGREIIFKVGLALLETSQDQLLQMDMEDMIKYFQKGMKSSPDIDADVLISKALKIKLNTKKMKKFGKEYVDKKTRKALENSEMGRLQTENMEMNLKLNKLQQEFDSLREQLITGQLTRAQQAEEIVTLRNDLAGARKKLLKLESEAVGGKDQRREGSVAAVPEWAETNGHARQEPHVSKVLSVSPKRSKSLDQESDTQPLPHEGVAMEKEAVSNHTLFDIYKDSSLSPQESPKVMRGLLDRGSKENLFVDESPADTSPTLESHVEKKKKKKRLLGRSKSEKRAGSVKSFDHDQESTGSPPPLHPEGAGQKEGKKKKKEKQQSLAQQELEKELVLSKTTCADYANQLEMKTLELKQVEKQMLEREAFLIRELKQVRQYVTELEAKVSNVSPEACPHCRSAGTTPGCVETTPPSSATPQDTGPNSSHALLTNLRAIWKSSNKKDVT